MNYPILCGCGKLARFKVAAEWSDGLTSELKTYAITCPVCLAQHLANAKPKAAKCRLLPGESLGIPGVYELAHPDEPRGLLRRTDLES